MLKIFILTIALAIPASGSIDLEAVRSAYLPAVKDKKLCSEMISKLKSEELSNVCLAYLGGYQTLWANHVFSPISKLKTFNEGKKNIETAVKRDPSNWEIRLVRLSVQKNAPRFLGYHQNISEDESYIRRNMKSDTSAVLLKMANQLLKD